MHAEEPLPAQFEALLDALERERDAAEPRAAQIDRVIAVGRALLDAHDVLSATIEAREEQVALQRHVIGALGLPLIQVRPDALCAPIIGELDPDRAARLTEALLQHVVDRGVRLAVVDMTGATISDATTAKHLLDVIHALRLVGVRGVISGMSAQSAAMVVEIAGGLSSVACYATVSRALEAHATGRD